MAIHDEICRSIDRFKDQAIGLGRQIHAHPELKFEERFAAGLLTGALGEMGVVVERGVAGLETAFRAEAGKSDRSGATVAILAEYDALPNGHSCGHNLICTAALSAFAGLAALRAQLPGRVVILGTPAEEGGGGKIIMLEKGALKGVDVAMMAHPVDGEYATFPTLATRHLRLTFHGHASHAAAAPWAGASALAAVIQTFQSVDAARLHFHDGSRIHGIITNGGQAVNIIPEKAECEFLCRAHTTSYTHEIADRVLRCAEAAAAATGTRLTHQILGGYKNMINNVTMAHRYAQHCETLGVKAPDAPPDMPTGSTDMGDVSHALPAIHPIFRIADPGAGNCHEERFAKHTDTPRAYEAMIRVAKAMALTAYDLLADPALMESAKREFAAREQS
ncbi:MAG: amidohydrolase [Candidatus Binataceae bacterium]